MVKPGVQLQVQRYEACCLLGQCAYNVDKVRLYLSVIRRMRGAGEDPGEAAASILKGGDGKAMSGVGDPNTAWAIRVWDVQTCLARGLRGPGAIARALCAYSDACTSDDGVID